MRKIVMLLVVSLFLIVSAGCSTTQKVSAGYGLLGGSLAVSAGFVTHEVVAANRLPDEVAYNWKPMAAALCTSMIVGVIGYLLVFDAKPVTFKSKQ